MNEILDQQYADGYSKDITRDFFKSVYSYMFVALGLSGVVAYWAANSGFISEYFMTATGGVSPLYYIILFAPVGLALLIQMAYRRLSFGVLMASFLGYAILMGLSLSSILLIFPPATILLAFVSAAGGFAAMAVLGYTTKTDLTKMGSLLYMAFIGIFIAGIANMFIGSGMLDFAISVIGVFVFTGLTAYYMQQLKTISQDGSLSGMDRSKLALVGGLQLYILFINLFMSLLRILGRD